eukprot:5640740-Ditylum_brightwellii.AAC.1
MKANGECMANNVSNSAPHKDSVHHVRLPIEESGFGLLRAIAKHSGVPIHRMRLWGTAGRSNGTIRVESCVTKMDLLTLT